LLQKNCDNIFSGEPYQTFGLFATIRIFDKVLIDTPRSTTICVKMASRPNAWCVPLGSSSGEKSSQIVQTEQHEQMKMARPVRISIDTKLDVQFTKDLGRDPYKDLVQHPENLEKIRTMGFYANHVDFLGPGGVDFYLSTLYRVKDTLPLAENALKTVMFEDHPIRMSSNMNDYAKSLVKFENLTTLIARQFMIEYDLIKKLPKLQVLAVATIAMNSNSTTRFEPCLNLRELAYDSQSMYLGKKTVSEIFPKLTKLKMSVDCPMSDFSLDNLGMLIDIGTLENLVRFELTISCPCQFCTVACPFRLTAPKLHTLILKGKIQVESNSFKAADRSARALVDDSFKAADRSARALVDDSFKAADRSAKALVDDSLKAADRSAKALVDDSHRTPVFSRFPNLRNLVLQNIPFDEQPRHFFECCSEFYPKLDRLEIFASKAIPEDLDFTKFKHLTELCIKTGSNFDCNRLEKLNIKKLTLSFFHRHSKSWLFNVPVVSNFDVIPRLGLESFVWTPAFSDLPPLFNDDKKVTLAPVDKEAIRIAISVPKLEIYLPFGISRLQATGNDVFRLGPKSSLEFGTEHVGAFTDELQRQIAQSVNAKLCLEMRVFADFVDIITEHVDKLHDLHKTGHLSHFAMIKLP
jgi:hypothetical protein